MLGTYRNGDTAMIDKVQSMDQIQFKFKDGTIDTDYQILKGTVIVSSIPGISSIYPGGIFTEEAKSMISNSQGATITIEIKYADVAGVKRIRTFEVAVQ